MAFELACYTDFALSQELEKDWSLALVTCLFACLFVIEILLLRVFARALVCELIRGRWRAKLLLY
jgi:hypothetical protein